MTGQTRKHLKGRTFGVIKLAAHKKTAHPDGFLIYGFRKECHHPPQAPFSPAAHPRFRLSAPSPLLPLQSPCLTVRAAPCLPA